MDWQSLILVQAVLVAVAMVVTRLLARDKRAKDASLAVTAGWFVALYACGLMMLPFFGNIHLSSLTIYWWRFILGGLAFALTNALTYYSLVYLEVSVGTILSTMSALFTIFGAAIFIHEDLSFKQLLGSAFLLAAIMYTIFATRQKSTKAVHRKLIIGFSFALVSALFYAVASVNEKSLLSHVSVGDYLLFGWFGEMSMAILLVLLIQPRALKLLREPFILRWTLSLGVLRATSGLCFILALIRSNNVALVTVISNFRLIIVVLLGVIFLKERQKIYQKLAGSALATVALSFMFWQK